MTRIPAERRASPVPAIFVALLILFTGYPLFADPASGNRILVINSYHSGLSWTDSVMNGIRDGFAQGNREIELSAEYLDARRFTDAESSGRIKELLAYKLKGAAPDVVMVSDNAALDFVLERRSALFPEVPVVFCGINHYSPSMISGSRRITGVAEDVSVGDTVGLALRLHPGTRELIVIGRTAVAADKANRDSFADALPPLPPGIKVTFWDDLPLPELRTRLEKLTSGSVVFINGLLPDEDGRQLMYGQTTEWVSRYTSVPLYSLWDVYLGHGIVGGKLVSGHRQGRMAAEQALRLLNGESADRIPVVTAQNANIYTFDYRQLERLGIPDSALPQGSVFINRPDSFYAQNKGFIWTLVGVILMLTVFVILLSVTVIRRRRAEELLRRATLVVESSPAILFRWKAVEGWPVELVSANVSQLGYTPEELLSGSVPFSSLVHPDDLDRVATEVEEHAAAGGDSFQQEYRIVRKDGVVRWIDDRTVIERDAEGRVTHYQGIILDITERKGAEEAIHQSEEKFRSLFMSLNEGFYLSELICDDEGNPCDYMYLDVNPEFELILGLGRDQIIGKRYKELVPVDSTDWLANYFKVALTGEPCTYTFYSNEYRMHFETYAYQPVKGQVCVLVINVTKRKRAEEALRESEEKFRVLAETSPTAIILCQGERILYANPATTSLSGYTSEELSCMNFWDCIHEDFREMVRERGLARQRGEAVPDQYESVIVTRRGEQRRVVVSGAPMIYGGVPTSIITLLDITEARRAEEKLRLTEEMFSSAFRASPDAITINRLDDGLYLDVNEGFCVMTGYTAEEVLGRTSVELNIWVRLEDRERLVGEITRHGFVTEMEAEFRRKDRTILVGQMSSRIIETDGAPCIVNIVRDITERKRSEEQIRASLAEKIVLLKEIHHRVKNNMQIISALLELQSDSITDKASRRFISESQNRIRSMALVHEKLYHSESFASINFGDYIESLTQYLFSCFVKDPDLIQLKVEVGDFSMEIDEAIPCGLIVNELVSNSLKHAFPGGMKGEIAVRCRCEEGGRLVLSVADNGIGMPSGYDIRNAVSLGLQLVSMLAKQLRGEAVIEDTHGGTAVTISFPG